MVVMFFTTTIYVHMFLFCVIYDMCSTKMKYTNEIDYLIKRLSKLGKKTFCKLLYTHKNAYINAF
jgi:hypothetical protein